MCVGLAINIANKPFEEVVYGLHCTGFGSGRRCLSSLHGGPRFRRTSVACRVDSKDHKWQQKQSVRDHWAGNKGNVSLQLFVSQQ
jgi:hypothetical protein